MHRVLIVDDEPLLSASLSVYLESIDELELELYTANSAIEALELMKTIRVDIIISDISMPGMSGIELHKKVIELWPHSKTILITGYDYIDYAKEVIRNGNVVDYILKNEEDEVIVDAIKKAILMINKDINQEALRINLEEKIHQSLPLLQEQFFLEMVYGHTLDEKSMGQMFKELSIKLNADNAFWILLGVFDTDLINEDYNTINVHAIAVRELIGNTISSKLNFHSVSVDTGKILWIIQKCDLDIHDGYIREIIELAQSSCEKLLNITVSFVLSKKVLGWKEIPDRYTKLRTMLRQQVVLLDGALIIEGQDSIIKQEPARDCVLQNLLNEFSKLKSALDMGNYEEFDRVFTKIMHLKDSDNSRSRLELLMNIQAFWINYISSNNLFQTVLYEEDGIDLIHFKSTLSWSTMILQVKRLAKTICSITGERDQERSIQLIKYIEKYINNNLDKDLSLTKVSEELYYSPSYFSKLFKQLKGSNFNDYVTNKRLDRAHSLLTRTNKRISDIAVEVGYSTPSYFIRAFKKKFNCSPQEYRNKHSK